MRGFGIVLAKECRDNLRDRRTMIASLSLALLGPIGFVALMIFVLNTAVGHAEERFTLTVVGGEYAPDLLDYLERQRIDLERVTLDDPRQAVMDGLHDLVLVIDPDYPERFAAGQVSSLGLIHNSARLGSAQRHFLSARQMIGAYSQKIGVLRLQLRGVEPTLLVPVQVAEIDTASPASRALTLLAALPYLLVLVIFMGGFYLAIDATAGEREHGSLEPLLAQPISRTQLVLGKLGAAALFSALALALFLTSLALALPRVPLQDVGMSLQFGFATCARIFLIAIPLIVFGAALLTAVACFAKSYKEAQTYLAMVILVPTVPLIVTQFLNLEPSAPLMLIPSLSQAMLISARISGETLPPDYAWIAALATALAAALVAAIAIALYRRERILI